ncbi:hypothetical protein ACUWE6_00030 [Bacillus subtilis subsp. subtilis]
MTAVKDKGGNTAFAAYVTPESADIEALKSAPKGNPAGLHDPGVVGDADQSSGYGKRQSGPQSLA